MRSEAPTDKDYVRKALLLWFRTISIPTIAMLLYIVYSSDSSDNFIDSIGMCLLVYLVVVIVTAPVLLLSVPFLILADFLKEYCGKVTTLLLCTLLINLCTLKLYSMFGIMDMYNEIIMAYVIVSFPVMFWVHWKWFRDEKYSTRPNEARTGSDV